MKKSKCEITPVQTQPLSGKKPKKPTSQNIVKSGEKSQYEMTPEQKKLILGKGEIKPTSGIMANFEEFCRETDRMAEELKKNPRKFDFSR